MSKRTLQIDEDLDFQRKEWLGQRIGISVLTLFVFAALLGLTGMGGPLSDGEARDAEGIVRVEYSRFVRRGAMATMTLHFQTAGAHDVQFWIDARYFDYVNIRTITPEPDVVAIEKERHVYTVRVGSPEANVELELEHKTIGRIDGAVGVVGGPAVHFSQVSMF